MSLATHLVGSVGLDSVNEVFRTAGEILGDSLRRVPDGEPGGRRLWVSWQYPLLRASPYLRPDPAGAKRKTSGFPLLCLGEGMDPAEISFGELGYAREARASYQDFCAAREAGLIRPGVKFQVCLPTPMGVVYAFCIAPDLLQVEPAYEKAMLDEVAALSAAIPHADLSIQWDVCHEVIMLDGQPQDHFPMLHASMPEVLARLARYGAAVPADVELGYHLCYGDFGAKHFIEPVDASVLVQISNGLARAVPRPVNYIHMPVPLTRTDDAYFAPLAGLDLAPETELYLGLVHLPDGAAGLASRIATARRHVKFFGIGTECGIARARKPGLVRQILELYRDGAAAG